jgi:hypothetical protein
MGQRRAGGGLELEWRLLSLPGWRFESEDVSVSCLVAELLAGICADCLLVIVPALPLSLGVETPVLSSR